MLINKIYHTVSQVVVSLKTNLGTYCRRNEEYIPEQNYPLGHYIDQLKNLEHQHNIETINVFS